MRSGSKCSSKKHTSPDVTVCAISSLGPWLATLAIGIRGQTGHHGADNCMLIKERFAASCRLSSGNDDREEVDP
jgi:hypothetical protein